MKKLARWTLNVVITLIGGWVLAHLITDPINMPAFFEDGLRSVLRVTGYTQFDNPDDLPVLGIMIVLVASWVVVGAIVLLVNRMIDRKKMRME